MSSTPTVRKFWSSMQYWTDSSWRSFLGECCSRSSMNWCFVMLVERLCLLKGDLFQRGACVCLFRYCHWILVGVTGVSQRGIFQVPAQRLCKLLMTFIKAQMVQSSLTSLLPGTDDFPAFWVLIQVTACLFGAKASKKSITNVWVDWRAGIIVLFFSVPFNTDLQKRALAAPAKFYPAFHHFHRAENFFSGVHWG